jgi:hypothetical protein
VNRKLDLCSAYWSSAQVAVGFSCFTYKIEARSVNNTTHSSFHQKWTARTEISPTWQIKVPQAKEQRVIAPKSPLVQFPTNFSQYLHQFPSFWSSKQLPAIRPPTSNLSRCSQPWKMVATYSRLRSLAANPTTEEMGDCARMLLQRPCCPGAAW